MTSSEFKKFMKNKTMYHGVCNWIERWRPGIEGYIPYNNIIVQKRVVFPIDSHYNSEEVLSKYTSGGRGFWEILHWKATKNNKNGLVYVTRFNAKGD